MKLGNLRSALLAAKLGRGAARALQPSVMSMMVAGALAVLAAPAGYAQQARFDFNIAAQPLVNALRAFSAQAKQQVLFDEEAVAGRNAPALQGSYTPREALDRLLAGTGIQVIVSGSGAFTLKRVVEVPGKDSGTLPAVAVTANADHESATGPVSGYVAKRSATGTKTDTELIKTPQAISVVTRDQMDVQNVQSVAQALRYSSGINPEQRGTNTDSLEYMYARGFQIDQYLNGLRLPGAAGGSGYNVTSFDPYMFERIELLHGPASVLYGQGSPGGIINLVSKRPTEYSLHEVGIQTGSYGRAQAMFDFSGPLNEDKTVLYRITGDGFSTGTQTDYVKEERYSLAPTITWRPTRDTNITVFANLQNDPKAGLYNSVPAQGTIQGGTLSIPRSLNTGDPSFDYFRKTQNSIGYEFNHRFDDTWSFKQNFRWLHNSQTVQYVANSGFATGGTSLTRQSYLNTGKLNAQTWDNQLAAKFSTGAFKHQAVIGLDYQRLDFDHAFYGNATAVPSLSVSAPVYGQAIPYPTAMFGSSNAQDLSQIGVYAQDQIEVGQWAFQAGVRSDSAEEKVTPYSTRKTSTQRDHAVTWRLGGVYQFDNGVAPYLSYAESFAPQVGTDFYGASFKPQTGQQYEAGIKFQPKGYNSFITAAVYQLEQNNVSTSDPAHTGFSIQTGQVRSKGIELEAHASLSNNLQVVASYTHNDLLNTQSTTASINKVPVGIPADTGSVWVDYTAKDGAIAGVQVGAGVRYVGSSYADVANTIKVPAVTLVDLALRYDLGRLSPGMTGWNASLNVSNLGDVNYIASCSGVTFCTWGLGRVVLAGLKYRW